MITGQMVEQHVGMSLSGPMPASVSLVNLINQAGMYLTNHHPWRWLQRRSLHLDLRAKVDFSAASLDATGFLLTVDADSIDDYVRVIGDMVELTEGTDGTGTLVPGFYEILAANASTNLLTLRTCASRLVAGGAPGGIVTAIVGSIETNSIGLPSDFKSLVRPGGIHATDTPLEGLAWTTPDRIAELRQAIAPGSAIPTYHACLGFAGPTPAPANESMTSIIEIVPTPVENTRNAFQGFYNAKWKKVLTAEELLVLPEELESCFLTLCELYAKGRLEADDGELGERLRAWEKDPDVIGAKRWDGSQQASWGMMRGGAVSLVRPGRFQTVPHRFTVQDPD